MVGSPGATTDRMDCRQVLSITGPGLNWSTKMNVDCFDLKEGLPLQVFATPKLEMPGNYYRGRTPMDGVVRNLVFTNNGFKDRVKLGECGCYAKDEEIAIESDKCVLNLGTFPESFPDAWRFSFELKINSLPGPTDPFWSFMILSGIDLFKIHLYFTNFDYFR